MTAPLPERLRGRQLLLATLDAWLADRAASMGAALAYYTLFSMAPLLLIALGVAGAVFGDDAARHELLLRLEDTWGAEGALTVAAWMKAPTLSTPVHGTVLGVLLLLIGASSVFTELQDNFDRIWKLPPAPAPAGLHRLPAWRSALRRRLLSLAMTLGVGAWLLLSLGVSAALSWWEPRGTEPWPTLLNLAQRGLNWVLLTGVFAAIYKFMPHEPVRWADACLGAVVTSVLFTAGKWAIASYLSHSGVATGFGAASALVAWLVWVYGSALTVLLGAEFTWVLAHRAPIDAAQPGVAQRTDAAAPQA